MRGKKEKALMCDAKRLDGPFKKENAKCVCGQSGALSLLLHLSAHPALVEECACNSGRFPCVHGGGPQDQYSLLPEGSSTFGYIQLRGVPRQLQIFSLDI